jgi:hypothetical protein
VIVNQAGGAAAYVSRDASGVGATLLPVGASQTIETEGEVWAYSAAGTTVDAWETFWPRASVDPDLEAEMPDLTRELLETI